MDGEYYCRIDEMVFFRNDLRIDKLYSLNVLCRSNDVSVLLFSLIEPKRVARNATNTSNKLRVVYDYI